MSGSRVKKGATIRVTVYGTLLTNGPTVKLPNLVGMLEWRAAGLQLEPADGHVAAP